MIDGHSLGQTNSSEVARAGVLSHMGIGLPVHQISQRPAARVTKVKAFAEHLATTRV
jgi:hypothetical protein